MSKTIDEKVVEMSFDNAQFERNIQTSISSLDRLKQSLNFGGVEDSLDDIDVGARNCASGMNGLSSGVESATNKFSAMEVIALTALVNITNSAIETGKRLVASLSIDQITSGFAKYEEKTTAVQTIINSTGKTIDEVNEQLEKLNWFTDETSYRFNDMVSNIGKFTSNGIDLEVSVTAMMGIANWAALSGQNAEAASRAMYNLSQAIGIGAVKLQDWKSIENANMATKEFKEIVIETAKALGTLDEEGKTVGGTLVESTNFSSTLSEGWFTSDVLLAALDKYGNYTEEVYKVASEQGITAADAMKQVSDKTMELGSKAFKAAQEAKTFTDAIEATKEAVSSGWSSTFEIIFGNYEEAKVLWTDLANELWDIFASSAEARNDLLTEWKDLGGRDMMVESLMNALTILKSIIESVSEAFHDIFPPMTAERLVEITEAVYNFTENLKENEELFENIKRVLRGFFAVLDIGKQLLGSILRVLNPIISKIPDLAGYILNLAANLGDFIFKVDDAIKESDFFYNVLSKVGAVVINVISYFKNLIKTIKDTEAFKQLAIVVTNAVNSLKGFIGKATENFKAHGFEIFTSILERIHWLLEKVGVVITKVVTIALNAISKVASAMSASSLFQVLSKIWSIIAAIAKCITNLLGKALGGLAEKIKEADIKGFLDLLNSLTLGGAIIWLVDFIKNASKPFETFKDLFDGIGDILDGVRGCFEAYQNKLKADTLMKIAGAIAILVASVFVLSLIKTEKLLEAVEVITLLFVGLMTSMSILTKMSGKIGQVTKMTGMMISMSLAVLILASALKKVASLDSDEMARGIIGVAGLTAIIVAAIKVLGSNSKKVMKGAFQLILFGIAINVLASACKTLAKLEWEELGKGLVGVGVLMAEVVAFLKFAKFNRQAFSTALGMILLASAIRILASACKVFAQMSWGDIAKGLVSVGALLAELIVFSKFTGKTSKMISIGIGLIAVAASMKIFASAMASMAKLSWEAIGKGLLSMAVCLTEVTVALNFIPKGLVGKGIGLIAVATALLIVAAAFERMGSMSWESIGKGLVALGGSLLILAVGLRAMKKTASGSAALLIAAVALGIFAPVLAFLGAMSWEAIGKGLLAIAGAFAVLGIAGLVLGPLTPTILGLSGALALLGVGALAISSAVLVLAVAITALATAGVAGATAIVAALTIIIEGFVNLVPTIAQIIASGIIEFVRIIGEGAPVIFETVKTVILGLIDVLMSCVPDLVVCIFTLLTSVLETLVEFAPTIIQQVFDILIACLEGLLNNLPRVVEVAVDIVVAFLEGIAKKLPEVIQAGFDLVISFINGIADALENNTGALMEAVAHLVKAILNSIVEILFSGVSLLIDVGKNLINGLIEGIKKAATGLWDTVCDVGNNIKNWFCDLLGIHSPSTVFAEYGKFMDEGLAIGLTKYSGVIEDATEEVSDSAIDMMNEAISEVSDIIDRKDLGEPTIRPVMDLSGIQNGANQLSKMMSDADGYNMSASVRLANKAADGMSYRKSDELSVLDNLAKTVKGMERGNNSSFTNTFNITGDNPKEIAEEVSRIIQKQVDRKGATWG